MICPGLSFDIWCPSYFSYDSQYSYSLMTRSTDISHTTRSTHNMCRAVWFPINKMHVFGISFCTKGNKTHALACILISCSCHIMFGITQITHMTLHVTKTFVFLSFRKTKRFFWEYVCTKKKIKIHALAYPFAFANTCHISPVTLYNTNYTSMFLKKNFFLYLFL